MSMASKFQKSYTRDTTLIIQQLWFKALGFGVTEKLSIKHSFLPVGIDYIRNGAIEIWENVEAKKFIKNALIQKSLTDSKHLKEFLLAYESGLNDFENIWKEGGFYSLKLLLGFVKKVDEAMCGDLSLCYLAGQKEANLEIRILSEKLRANDHFFSSNDFVIRESLKKIFPELADYVNTIRLEELSGGIPSLDECRKRFENYVVSSDGYSKIQTLEEFKKIYSQFLFKGEKGDFEGNEVRGRIGVKGKFKGIVRVVNLIRDIEKVQVGDVIVSTMTTPSFMPALIKAGAFITDEGGVLCHAVVVAREMNKPCVISTKIATSILKDGDLVEVDSNEGVVRILKRAGDK